MRCPVANPHEVNAVRATADNPRRLFSLKPQTHCVRLAWWRACTTIFGMDDPALPAVRGMLDNALESAQRLAIDVIEYPADKRDEVMQRMGVLLTEVAQEAGCCHEMALEFGNAMEQAIRDYVAEIEASGGGTVGTA
jgi:hypothetical protein